MHRDKLPIDFVLPCVQASGCAADYVFFNGVFMYTTHLSDLSVRIVIGLFNTPQECDLPDCGVIDSLS